MGMLKGRSENGGMENDAWELLVAVVDGQGGGMGRGLVEAVKKKVAQSPCAGAGDQLLATAAMLPRAGADDGATGENAVAFNARRADILLGPIGVLTPNGLLGRSLPGWRRPLAAARR